MVAMFLTTVNSMIIQIFTFTRPDTSAPWFNDAPEMANFIAAKEAIRTANPDIMAPAVTTFSDDGLTCTVTQTFPTKEYWRTYSRLVREATNEMADRNQYFAAHGHKMTVTMHDTYED